MADPEFNETNGPIEISASAIHHLRARNPNRKSVQRVMLAARTGPDDLPWPCRR
jgi:hypothetical protein